MITYPDLGNAGRLGNQLWEIASTLGIAHTRGEQASFPPWAYQPYFCIPEHFFTGQEGTPSTEFVHHMSPQALPYLQDFSLIRPIEREIRIMFQPSRLALETLHSSTYDSYWKLEPPILALHVRRGDYLETPDHFPLPSISYYEEAIRSRDHGSVVVFSDDLPWCRTALGHVADFFFEGTADWIDLHAQVSADFHVISNSTFSWWGAFLSDDKEPIYPVPWYGKMLRSRVDASLMFPKNWKGLSC